MSDMENTESNEMLNAAIKQITQNKRWSFNHKFKYGYELLRALKAHDDQIDFKIEKNDKRSSKSCSMIIIAFLGIFIAPMIIGGVFGEPGIGIGAGAVFAVLFVLAIIFSFVFIEKYKISQKQDLSNDFKDIIIPLLELLKDDIHPKLKAKIDIDFTAADGKAKMINEEELPPGDFIFLKKETYCDPWCKLELPLNNGSVVKLNITSHIFKFSRIYRSVSGKRKGKTKWKALVEVSAILFPDSERLAVDTNLVSNSQIGSIKPGSKGDRDYVQLKKKYKVKQSTPLEDFKSPVKVDDIMHMLITLCKSAAKAKGE